MTKAPKSSPSKPVSGLTLEPGSWGDGVAIATVKDLRAALAKLPDDMPVYVEDDCSEGCGVGREEAGSCRVDDLDWPAKGERLALVISDARR